jgi:hypothetical protein
MSAPPWTYAYSSTTTSCRNESSRAHDDVHPIPDTRAHTPGPRRPPTTHTYGSGSADHHREAVGVPSRDDIPPAGGLRPSRTQG